MSKVHDVRMANILLEVKEIKAVLGYEHKAAYYIHDTGNDTILVYVHGHRFVDQFRQMIDDENRHTRKDQIHTGHSGVEKEQR